MPTLRGLLDGPHEVVGVVSQPDRPSGRGRKLTASPVARLAQEAGVPLHRPEKVGAPDVAAALAESEPDLGVVVAFGQFLPKRIRELPKLGYLINGHASLLPRHRGAAPIAHAILAGDETTGISVMRVEREMDAGAVTLVRETEIGAEETRGELEERMATLCSEAIDAGLDAIAAGTAVWIEQDHGAATEAPKIERRDADLDFEEPADAVARRVRATSPRPGASCLRGEETLRILGARSEAEACSTRPGQVALGEDGRPRIACGEGWLIPTRLQRAGGKPLSTDDFQRGRGLLDGEQLESARG